MDHRFISKQDNSVMALVFSFKLFPLKAQRKEDVITIDFDLKYFGGHKFWSRNSRIKSSYKYNYFSQHIFILFWIYKYLAFIL